MENGVCWDSSWLKLLGLSVEKAFFLHQEGKWRERVKSVTEFREEVLKGCHFSI